jgi:hypothetical protein
MTTKSRNSGRSSGPREGQDVQTLPRTSSLDASGKELSVHEPVEQQLESVLSGVVSPAELSKAKREVLRVFEQHDSYQGPIPPPALFRQFEEIPQ